MKEKYPQNTIIALLGTEMLTEPTKKVLVERLFVPVKLKPDFFSEDEYQLLISVSKRLLPQEGDRKIDLAGMLDTSLANGFGNGWRYDTMPPDDESFKKGIAGIEQTSLSLFGCSFLKLSAVQQDEVLLSIQGDRAAGVIWEGFPAALFFEELLVALTELYYSHPYGREEIGDLSVADNPGWEMIGLNEREPREPQEASKSQAPRDE